jgi:hypothetical protein
VLHEIEVPCHLLDQAILVQIQDLRILITALVEIQEHTTEILVHHIIDLQVHHTIEVIYLQGLHLLIVHRQEQRLLVEQITHLLLRVEAQEVAV